MWARISAGGLAPPLYLHSSLLVAPTRAGDRGVVAQWEARVRAAAPAATGGVCVYHGDDPVAEFLNHVTSAECLMMRLNGFSWHPSGGGGCTTGVTCLNAASDALV